MRHRDEHGLTLKDLKFVAAYLGPANCNATKAARMAGSKANGITLRTIGSDLLAKPNIHEEIRRRFREGGIGPEEVVKRLADQCRVNMLDFVTLDENGMPIVDLRRAKKAGKGMLIRKVKATKFKAHTTCTLEVLDSTKALITMARIHGLLALDLPEAEDTSIPILTDAEAKAAREAILKVRAEATAGRAPVVVRCRVLLPTCLDGRQVSPGALVDVPAADAPQLCVRGILALAGEGPQPPAPGTVNGRDG